MKQKPILFSTPMVQAILAGRKTMTRRIIKRPPVIDKDSGYKFYDNLMFDIHDNVLEEMYMPDHAPYRVGEIMWVRETWRIDGWNDGDPFTIGFRAGGKKHNVYLDESKADDYACDCSEQCLKAGLKPDEFGMFHFTEETNPIKWKPSIFMPREACRIFLEVTNVRVERLNDITEEDAIAEGLKKSPDFMGGEWGGVEPKGYWSFRWYQYPVEAFKNLWIWINGKDSWDSNPWVWVYEFKQIEKP